MRARALAVAATAASVTSACTLLTDTAGLSGGAPSPPGAGGGAASVVAPAAAPSGRAPGDGGAARPPLCHGPCVPFVVANDDSVGAVVADDDGVYWTSNGIGDVRRAAVDGSRLVTVFHGDRAPEAIAVDATRIYWTEPGAGNVRAVRKDADHGDLEGELTMQGAVRQIAVSGDAVFFFDDVSRNIEQTTTSLGAPTVFANVDLGEVIDLRATRNRIYFGVSGASINVVRSISRGVPGLAATDVTGKVSTLDGYALDDMRIYFGDSETGLVKSVDLAGGSPKTHSSAEPGAFSIAVDDAYVYWTTRPAAGGGLVRRIQKAAKAGAEPETLASGQTGPFSVTVNRYGVYWATTDQRVMGVQKP